MFVTGGFGLHHFCTLFDKNYLVKGVAMLRSLYNVSKNVKVYVLCMDNITHEILDQLSLSWVVLINLEDIEDDEILAVKPTRSSAEYCWTLSPCLPWYVLEKFPEIQEIVYLDADLCFYSSINPVFEEIGLASISIVEHRFPYQFKHMEINGRFCVEWVSFKRDIEGLACLKRWREQCIEWCFHRLENGKMGDQKYLDEWPSLYSNLCVIQNPGVGVAPWNFAGHSYGIDHSGEITVDNDPLVFYHFHQFQITSNDKFDRLSAAYRLLGDEPESVYLVYESAVRSALAEIRTIVPGFSCGLRPVFRLRMQRLVQNLFPLPLKKFLKKFIKAV